MRLSQKIFLEKWNSASTQCKRRLVRHWGEEEAVSLKPAALPQEAAIPGSTFGVANDFRSELKQLGDSSLLVAMVVT